MREGTNNDEGRTSLSLERGRQPTVMFLVGVVCRLHVGEVREFHGIQQEALFSKDAMLKKHLANHQQAYAC